MSAPDLSPQDARSPTALRITLSQDHALPENEHMVLQPVWGLVEPWTQPSLLFDFMHQFVTMSQEAHGP